MSGRPVLTVTALMLGLIVLAIGIVTPIFTRRPGQPLTSLHRGRSMYDMISAWAEEDGPGGWPRHGTNATAFAFDDSTAYFRRLLGAVPNTFDYSFFSLRGMTSARTTNAMEFTSVNNAWCIVADVDEETPEGTPVLFTRNINVTNTSQFVGPAAVTLVDEPPYGRDVAIVVLRGGTVKNVSSDQTWEMVLGDIPPGNRPVLRP